MIKQKILTFLCAALMSVGMWAAPANSCGPNLTWNLSGGVLTISGTGAMNDYYEDPAPWIISAGGSITSVSISNGVTHIGAGAFYGISNLPSVTIPNSVTSIGAGAFFYCAGLTSITIPNSVTSIGHRAFCFCSNLTSITIPNSVTSIGAAAFGGCTALTSMVVADGNTKYDSRGNCNAIIEKSTNTLIQGCKITSIPNSVTSIGEGAFAYFMGLTSIEIPSSVTSIGERAFNQCSDLTSIEIPSSVTSIGAGAFSDCTGLTSVTIPNSVTSIGQSAFKYCEGLTSIEIPNSVTSIGGSAFYECSNLASVTILAESLESYGSGAFDDTHADLKIYVPAGSVNTYKTEWSEYEDKIVAAPEKVTIIFNDLGLANEYNLTTGPLTVGNIELNFDKANGSNPPAFYTTGGGTARLYKGNTMSISAGGATITKIVFNLAQGTPTFNTGSYNATTKTWEGEATTLTLSNEMASGQVRIKSMDVYYTEASTGYSVSLKEGTEDATSWQGKAGTGEYQSLPLTGLEAGTAVSVKYNGTKTVWSVKAKKKAAAPLIVNPAVGQVIGDDGKNYDYASLPGGVTAVAKITYVGSDNGEEAPYNHGLALALSDANGGNICQWKTEQTDAGHTYQPTTSSGLKSVSESGLQYNAMHNSEIDNYPAFKAAIANNGTAAPTGCSAWFLASGYQWTSMMNAAGSDTALRDGFSSVGGSNLQSAGYWSSTEMTSTAAWNYYFNDGAWYNLKKDKDKYIGVNHLVRACLAWAEGSDPEPIELTSTDGETWTLTMPDGDVELEVTCFNATAPTANTTDIHARTTTPLINAASTTEEGATIKYLVTATSEQPTSTDGFSADVPTAQAITAPGTYYVWYYLDFATGDDSDIYPTAIQVTVAAAPTVTLKEGTEDADNWTITPPEAKTTGVAEGTEVTATYSGTKLVKSVKAVKKVPTPAAEATAEDKGKLIGTDGNIYADVAAATAAGTTAVAMIAYVGSETGVDGYTHGLALALTDEASTMSWTDATGASGAAAHTPAAPTTTSSWMLPSKDQWQQMFAAFGGNSGSYTGLNTAIGNAGGTAFVVGMAGMYWTSTKNNDSTAYSAFLYNGQAGLGNQDMDNVYYVRACLAF